MPDPLDYESRKPDSTPAANRVCPKCRGSMTEGFMPDRAHSSVEQALWVEGQPEKKVVLGIEVGGFKIKGRVHVPITTYRCQSCGYLESYATNS